MKKASLAKNEKGFMLIEVLLALAILGIIATAFLSGLATASKAISIADERTTAESLARSQMEYVKKQPYDDAGAYAEIDTPANYEIGSLTVVELQTGLQKITITITHNDKEIITLEGYKVDR